MSRPKEALASFLERFPVLRVKGHIAESNRSVSLAQLSSFLVPLTTKLLCKLENAALEAFCRVGKVPTAWRTNLVPQIVF
jgi:hypothetical protein